MKTLRLIAIGAMACASAAIFAQRIPVIVNGQPVQFEGQGPIMSGSRVLVPLRGVLEQMGATVQWDPQDQTVRAEKNGTRVRLRIGETTASVNGNAVDLDVPAQIIRGSTMVPLRFVGEALGEVVHWDAQRDMVEINTGEDYGLAENAPIRNRPDQSRPEIIRDKAVIPAGTVIPVTLDDSLSSDNNTRGDKFTATVQSDNAQLPPGTKVDGVVEGARPKRADKPGMLELRFTRVDLPNGDSYSVNGTLIGLDRKSVTRRGDRLVATANAPDRAVYTGVGAGAGLILGLATRRPIEDAILGGLAGFGASFLQDRNNAHNVRLDAGTTFGVRLRNDLSFSQ